MAKLTAQQANELANDFLALAQSVGDYRYENFDSLTESEKREIKDLHWSILKYADDLYTQSATLVMDDVEESLASINNITDQIKGSYKALQDVQKAIEVAASIATLGAAIISKNPLAIADSIKELVEICKE